MKMGEKQHYFLVHLLMLVVFFSEFINMPFSSSTQVSTIIMNVLYLLIIVISIFRVAKQKGITIDKFFLFFWLFVGVYLISFILSQESTYDKIMSVRGTIVYLSVAVFIYKFISSEKLIDKLITNIYRLGIFFGLFGIVQGVFRTKLPPELLMPKNYDSPYVYFGTDIVRANGLLGNMIIYGSIMLLFYAIFINKFFSDFKLESLLASVISFSAILCTFSRAALMGAATMTAVLFLKSLFSKGNRKSIIFLSLFISTGIIILYLSFGNLLNSFLFSSVLTSSNQSVQWSNQGHMMLITEALKTIQDNPIFGSGIATQKKDSIFSLTHIYVTDGAFFSTFLEIGILGILINSLLILFAFYISIKSLKIEKYRYLATGFLFFSIYNFFFACIVNSAYYGRTMYILYWTLFGIILSIYRSHINEIKVEHKQTEKAIYNSNVVTNKMLINDKGI